MEKMRFSIDFCYVTMYNVSNIFPRSDNVKKSNDKFRTLARELTSKLTLDEKLGLITTHNRPVERLGIGEFFIGQEVARGYVGRSDDRYSTVFPQPIGLASTFDRELMSEIGTITANECRAYYNIDKKGGLCVWGPTVDMERDSRWGRNEEAYGEDVFLTGELTAAFTETMAGDNGEYLKTIPTLKHFCANNNEHERLKSNSFMPLRLKYEYFYQAFRNAIVNGGAKSVMSAYNEVNGVPALCNTELQSILKDEWGLWFAVTDGGDFGQTVTAHRYTSSHAEAYAESITAGCDTMTDIGSLVSKAAKNALDRGLISEADIDRAVENVLYARAKLGQFSDDCPYDSITTDIVNTEQSEDVDLRAAREQVVLLKNDGILPLKKAHGKIAVLGPAANENLRDWYTGTFRSPVSIAEGIRREFAGREIVHDSLWDIVAIKAPNGKYLSVHEDGTVHADAEAVTDSERFELQDWGENWKNLFSVKYQGYVTSDGALHLNGRTIFDWFTRETFNFYDTDGGVLIEEYLHRERLSCTDGKLTFVKERAVVQENIFVIETLSSGRERAEKAAAESDVVIYCTGNYPTQVAKECFDRSTLRLNVQEGMAEHIFGICPSVVMVLVSSYPYSVCRENELLPAVLYTTHAGAQLGTAVAETLSGRNNPSAKLPETWYRSDNDLPDIMSYDIEKSGTTYMYFKGTPLYPFGYGLSYSTFEYSGFSVTDSSGKLTARLTVRNTSDADGTEIVQIYYTLKASAVRRADKKLCGFERVSLKAGESREILIDIPEYILRIYDTRSGRMLVEDGDYTFYAAASSADIRSECECRVSGEMVGNRPCCFEAQSFDDYNNVIISFSRRLRRHYVTVRGWDAWVKYSGVDLTGRTELVMSISSCVSDEKVRCKVGGHEFEVPVSASDGYDDFAEYTAKLPDGLSGVHDLALSLGEGVSVLDISLR